MTNSALPVSGTTMPRTEAGVRGFGVAKLAAGCMCIDVVVGNVAVGGCLE